MLMILIVLIMCMRESKLRIHYPLYLTNMPVPKARDHHAAMTNQDGHDQHIFQRGATDHEVIMYTSSMKDLKRGHILDQDLR